VEEGAGITLLESGIAAITGRGADTLRADKSADPSVFNRVILWPARWEAAIAVYAAAFVVPARRAPARLEDRAAAIVLFKSVVT